jgi:hypothetical protein
MLPSDAPFLEAALALLALSFRPVTVDVLLPAFPVCTDALDALQSVSPRFQGVP